MWQKNVALLTIECLVLTVVRLFAERPNNKVTAYVEASVPRHFLTRKLKFE